MKCPYCACQDTRVIDSRDSADAAVRRRRQCVACGKRFTTYERWERPDLRVLKRDGRVEDFDRDKLEVGILKACEKRPIARAQMLQVIDEIEEELRAGDAAEVTSNLIGDLVLRSLRGLDQVAYLRFASVYRAFHDVSHFEKELKNLRLDDDEGATPADPANRRGAARQETLDKPLGASTPRQAGLGKDTPPRGNRRS